MPDLGEYTNVVQAIGRRLVAAEWQQIKSDGNAEWYAHLLGDTALAVGSDDAAIIYVDSTFTWGSNHTFEATVLVFTKGTVVRSVAQGRVDGFTWTASTSTVAEKREGLQTLRVASNRSPFSTDAFADWPGTVSFTAEYKSGMTFSLPAGPVSGDTARSALHDLFVSLREELASV